ncbi:hypothetical protein FQR65_LT01027 [Abscondita terminalis]|nr:hypothetical protein FQR65_LT01027 [Abscondita terminalis]
MNTRLFFQIDVQASAICKQNQVLKGSPKAKQFNQVLRKHQPPVDKIINSCKYLEYGEAFWKEVLQISKCQYTVFNTHQIYPDHLISSLASACAEITSDSYDSFMHFFGICFVRYTCIYGYDVSIKATGRFFADFLQSVDNIHSQFRFTYPKMKSPSMYLTEVSETGCNLVYRSVRHGFKHYLMGQLQQVAKQYFNLEVKTTVLGTKMSKTNNRTLHVIYVRLEFDNTEYMKNRSEKEFHMQTTQLPPVPCEVLLTLFPFGVLINSSMEIVGIGDKLAEVWGNRGKIVGQSITKYFRIQRPKGVLLTWKNLYYLRSVQFSLEFLTGAVENTADSSNTTTKLNDNKENVEISEQQLSIFKDKSTIPLKSYQLRRDSNQALRNILLKGQMKYMKDINIVIFLCSPIINDLDELTERGLFLNDLNFHGLSREMVLAGWQHNSKLELTFEKAEQRSIELEHNYKLLDTWKRRGDDLLYSMIPKMVADRLRAGDSSLSTCESFDCVTIMFCDLVGINSDTVQDAMDLVSSMNEVFSCFDKLMDKYNVYKVETVDQIYMAASGAPEKTRNHAENVANLSLSMIENVKSIRTPSGGKVEIRIGIHSGPTVAGIVGIKVPRYCFFGDTVNTASRMQSSSLPGHVHISSVTKEMLLEENYEIQSRGTTLIKLEYGEQIWTQILKIAGSKHSTFNTHQVYSDETMGKLAEALTEITSSDYNEYMKFFGQCFVRYFSTLGYDLTIRAIGRYFTDFLQNVDNIHTQFCFSYPKMKSPNIYVSEISATGCVMVYRSERLGFTYYMMGLLDQIAKDFFGIEVNIKVIDDVSVMVGDRQNKIVKYQINFDNSEYIQNEIRKREPQNAKPLPPVRCYDLLELFPFAIIINSSLEIVGVGLKLVETTKVNQLLGSTLGNYFKLRRPKGITLEWKNLLHLRMILFEIELLREEEHHTDENGEDHPVKNILLKGQMKHIEDINAIIFLCSPVINDVDELPELGIYVNDLNQHGLSKEMVCAGWQHNSKLEVLFDEAEHRSVELETNYELLETWKKRSDELLYSMIPKTVADRMRSGNSPLSTCETFESLSILFCELLDLHSTTVQEAITVVDCMNSIFSCFDALMDKFQVYKVETVGCIYMVAGGAPERTDSHAQRVADLALSMIEEVAKLKFTDRKTVEIKIGIHSGSAVAGVVGIKVPRYCFFGDTINTASRMQSTSKPGNINISNYTKKLLPNDQYNFESRGLVKVKLEYGRQIWTQILQMAGFKYSSFNTHRVYPDDTMAKLAEALAKVTSGDYNGYLKFFGQCFVKYFSNFGYDITIRAVGRYFTDFLENVDNIHTQFCFTYPKMKSPNIYVSNINENGCIMVYRSERSGFNYYIMGLLDQIAKDFFDIEIEIRVIDEVTAMVGDRANNVIKFKIDFDNRAFIENQTRKRELQLMKPLKPLPCRELLNLFPFGILIDSSLEIIGLGVRIVETIGEFQLMGTKLDRNFKLRRPKGITLEWSNLINLRMVLFEIELIREEQQHTDEKGEVHQVRNILLKGQMKHITDINIIIYLCSPIVNGLDELAELGIFLNDLNHHGLSREMVFAGWQHNSKLEVLFDEAEHKSVELESNYDLLETWKKRSDELLYSMIPKSVADRMRSGNSLLSTCETFESLSILFCELLDLQSSTVEGTVSVVDCMNSVFSCFDALMDKFQVYKVETVGCVYMVAGGAPERTELHAQRVADLGLSMIEEVSKITFLDKKSVAIRIGIHSGPAVAGVVGIKMPRYCFFGDTINTASRMQSTSKPGNINISRHTKKLLPEDRYNFESRGLVQVKGKGQMETFFLTEKK